MMNMTALIIILHIRKLQFEIIYKRRLLNMDYKSAGVDTGKGESFVAKIKAMMGPGGSAIGHFGGAIPLPTEGYRHPMLVTSIDGVGTKVKIAVQLGIYDTIGCDIVHHCVNDIACCGAKPLAFLDYLAMNDLDQDVATEILKGIIDSCQNLEITLAGGETAEMPGVYAKGELDLVGSIMGIVEADNFIDGSSIDLGDILIGIASNGLHTNGYSLARTVIAEAGHDYNFVPDELECSLGETLLAVHRCYLIEIKALSKKVEVKGLAHITGGGLEGNVSRIIPKGLKAEINWGTWDEPKIFELIRKWGSIEESAMHDAFNLGVGMVVIVPADQYLEALDIINTLQYQSWEIGKVG
jgi:phosphoribosylformylglycinamidine cyclo-ligase